MRARETHQFLRKQADTTDQDERALPAHLACSKFFYEVARSFMKSLALLFAFVAGTLITCQVGSNTQLKKSLGQPLPALLVNYVVGIAAAFLYTFMKQEPLPSAAKALQTPWWGWLGGLFGAVYGLTAIILASQLGAATLTALVVTGQLICSVILDHFGWLSFDVHPASWPRVAGCGLMVVGLILIAKF